MTGIAGTRDVMIININFGKYKLTRFNKNTPTLDLLTCMDSLKQKLEAHLSTRSFLAPSTFLTY